MAASAVKRLARSPGVLWLNSGGGSSCGEVRPVRNIAVAQEAYLDGLVHEQRHLVRRVGDVAGHAVAGRNGRMDVLFCKTGLVMAGKTQSRGFCFQQFCVLRRVRVVAAGAAHADRRMNVFLGKHPPIVAAVAQIRLLRREPPCYGGRFLVRHGPGIYPRVTGGAPHCKRLMHELPFCQLHVAVKTIYYSGRGKRTGKEGAEEHYEDNQEVKLIRRFRPHGVFLL